jgi:DNA polymerase sigma
VLEGKPGKRTVRAEGDYPVARYENEDGVIFTITVNNRLSIKAAELLNAYFMPNKYGRRLCQFIKVWARHKNIATRRHFASYTWTLLVINFL